MTSPLIVFIVICYAAIAQAFVARMDGGGQPQTPEPIERFLAILPYAVLGFLLNPIAGVLNLISYIALGTGHGQYFPDTKNKAITPEFVDPAVALFYGQDPRTKDVPSDEDRDILIAEYGRDRLRARCALGMAMTGLLVVIVPVITTIYFLGLSTPIPFLLLASAPAKALAYLVPHRFGYTTEFSEYLHGAVRGFIQFTCIAICPTVYIMRA